MSSDCADRKAERGMIQAVFLSKHGPEGRSTVRLPLIHYRDDISRAHLPFTMSMYPIDPGSVDVVGEIAIGKQGQDHSVIST